MSVPATSPRSTQIACISMKSSGSHSFAKPVNESPSPPAQSPTTHRVNPTDGCSTRHASTSLSSAALLTAYAPSPGHGAVCDALTDERYTSDAARRGEVGERGRRDERGAGDVRVEHAPPGLDVGVGEPSERTDGGRVDECVDSPEVGRGLLDRRAARVGIGDVALDGERVAPGLAGRRFQPLAPAGEQTRRAHLAAPDRRRCTGRVRSTRRPLLLATLPLDRHADVDVRSLGTG